jgi:capsular polysaccharide transport system ATP-binding protein
MSVPAPASGAAELRVARLCKDYSVHARTRRVLDDISFSLARGQKMAVFGRNGAGKSTLMKLVAGVEPATSGTIERTMSLSWPLALTGGFHGDLTGRDNIRCIARIYGAPIDDTAAFVDDFAELGAQLSSPLYTYSSGMRARLAFALSLSIEFDCYLIDEVISVGDQRFHRRCHEELFEKRRDRAMLMATHDVGLAREFCSSALVLKAGRARVVPDLKLAADIYYTL